MLTGIAVNDGASSALDWEGRHNSRMESMARQMMSGMGSLALSGHVGDCCDEDEVRPFFIFALLSVGKTLARSRYNDFGQSQSCIFAALSAPLWCFRAAYEPAGGMSHFFAPGVVANIAGVLCSSPTCTREQRSRQSTCSRQRTRSTIR